MGVNKYNIDEYINKKIGHLTLVEYIGSASSHHKFKAKCDCGKEVSIYLDRVLKDPDPKCKFCKNPHLIDVNDYIGKKYGTRTIIADAGKNAHGSVMVLCECECGERRVLELTLVKNNYRSGCAKCHKFYRHEYNDYQRLRRLWTSMKQRCYNPKTQKYKDYGGRGIKVCDEWKNDSKVFIDWAINNGYKQGLSIDRIDVNGNYCPENCRWATAALQSVNKRNSRQNKSGYQGIFLRSKNLWEVKLSYEGKVFRKAFPTLKEAVEARNQYIIDNNLPHLIQEYKEEN